MCSPTRQPVSNAQVLETLRIVYPPPPTISVGRPYDLTKLTQFACPLMLRLKQPNRSPERLSPPHCRTTACGLYHSIVALMTGSKIPLYETSSIPSRSGKLTE